MGLMAVRWSSQLLNGKLRTRPIEAVKALVIANNLYPFDGGSNDQWHSAIRTSGFGGFDHVNGFDFYRDWEIDKIDDYEAVIIPGGQSTEFYNYLVGAGKKLEDYVVGGGVLSYGVAISPYRFEGAKPPKSIWFEDTSISTNINYQTNALVYQHSDLSLFSEVRSLDSEWASTVQLGVSNSNGTALTIFDGGSMSTQWEEIGNGDVIVTGLTLESPHNSQEWRTFYSDYLQYLEALSRENKFGSDIAENFNNIKGTNNKDNLIGAATDDIIVGRRGGDILNGGAGNDILRAGNGRDVITGGPGNDDIYGGFGHNTFNDERDGSEDWIYFKSDQLTYNYLYGKAGNNPNGMKVDILKGLDKEDRIFVQGAQNYELSFSQVNNFSAPTGNFSGIGIFANGFLEGIYTGGDLSLAQLQSMTNGINA